MKAKVQFLLRPRGPQRHAAFADAIRRELAPGLLAADPAGLRLTLTEAPPPRLSMFPFARRPLGLVSLWLRSDQDLAPFGEALAAGPLVATGYRVEESIVTAYANDWPDGAMTPGPSLLTVFRRRPGLDDETFLQRWFEGHSALTLEVHPVWQYVRNRVLAPLEGGAPPVDGIVEEHFRTDADLLHPFRFYGAPSRFLLNVARVGIDVARFLHLPSIETALAREITLRTP